MLFSHEIWVIASLNSIKHFKVTFFPHTAVSCGSTCIGPANEPVKRNKLGNVKASQAEINEWIKTKKVPGKNKL